MPVLCDGVGILDEIRHGSEMAAEETEKETAPLRNRLPVSDKEEMYFLDEVIMSDGQIQYLCDRPCV